MIASDGEKGFRILLDMFVGGICLYLGRKDFLGVRDFFFYVDGVFKGVVVSRGFDFVFSFKGCEAVV